MEQEYEYDYNDYDYADQGEGLDFSGPGDALGIFGESIIGCNHDTWQYCW
jgi:hypothetical protein